MIFRYRFWLLTAAIGSGFLLYTVDHVNATVALVQWLRGGTGILRAGFFVAALFAVLAALVRTWATAYMQTSVVHDIRLHTESLVASGPYRYVRNPLYLGVLLLVLGLGMLASRIGLVVMLGGSLVILLALINEEERQLTAAQGESYAAYRRAVPRLIPSLTPRVPRAPLAPRWGQAFLGEGMFWGYALGMIVFAITLQPTWLTVLWIGAPVAHLLLVSRARRSLQSKAAGP